MAAVTEISVGNSLTDTHTHAGSAAKREQENIMKTKCFRTTTDGMVMHENNLSFKMMYHTAQRVRERETGRHTSASLYWFCLLNDMEFTIRRRRVHFVVVCVLVFFFSRTIFLILSGTRVTDYVFIRNGCCLAWQRLDFWRLFESPMSQLSQHWLVIFKSWLRKNGNTFEHIYFARCSTNWQSWKRFILWVCARLRVIGACDTYRFLLFVPSSSSSHKSTRTPKMVAKSLLLARTVTHGPNAGSIFHNYLLIHTRTTDRVHWARWMNGETTMAAI